MYVFFKAANLLVFSNALDKDSVRRADYCVIGSGMGGSAVAARLARAGKDVLLVEAGQVEADSSDALTPVTAEHTGRPFGIPVSRCIELGGTSNAWHGVCTPLDDIDFAPRPWLDEPGWPIRRSDLDPFYREAARQFGHDRLAGLQPECLPSAVQHSLRALDIEDRVLERKILEYRTPPFRWKQTLLELARTNTIRCLVGAAALELVSTENGSRISVLKAGAPGRSIRIEANTYIVSAGTLETPRLLLNSRSRSANGIGNDHDLVGRFLLDHPTGPASMLRFHSTRRAPAYSGLPLAAGSKSESNRGNLHSKQLMAALTLTQEQQEAAGVPNHYFLVRPSIGPHHVEHHLRLSFLATRSMRDLTPRQAAGIISTPNLLYRILVNKCGVPAWYRYGEIFVFAEQIRSRESRVRLSAQKRDGFGYPVACVNWEPSGKDISGFEGFTRAALDRGLQSSKYSKISEKTREDWEREFTSAAHHLGTARMASDPRYGVVDANLKVYGAQNLYICDGSVFATSGSANPSLTITALGFRLADHLMAKSAMAGAVTTGSAPFPEAVSN